MPPGARRVDAARAGLGTPGGETAALLVPGLLFWSSPGVSGAVVLVNASVRNGVEILITWCYSLFFKFRSTVTFEDFRGLSQGLGSLAEEAS